MQVKAIGQETDTLVGNVTRFILMRYFGYMLKAGHIAVVATAATTERYKKGAKCEILCKLRYEIFLNSHPFHE